jgi:hypothetical protein
MEVDTLSFLTLKGWHLSALIGVLPVAVVLFGSESVCRFIGGCVQKDVNVTLSGFLSSAFTISMG